jgi:hypothetical protein
VGRQHCPVSGSATQPAASRQDREWWAAPAAVLSWKNTSSRRHATRDEMSAAPLISGRLHRPEAHAPLGTTRERAVRARATTATAGESERKPAAAVERLLTVLSVAERTPPPPGRPSGHARPVRGRRAADAGRHAIGLLDIGVRGRRHGRPEPAAGAPSRSARRPDRLAFYMGCCPHRREGPVRCGTLPSPSVIRTPDRGLLGAVEAVAETRGRARGGVNGSIFR